MKNILKHKSYVTLIKAFEMTDNIQIKKTILEQMLICLKDNQSTRLKASSKFFNQILKEREYIQELLKTIDMDFLPIKTMQRELGIKQLKDFASLLGLEYNGFRARKSLNEKALSDFIYEDYLDIKNLKTLLILTDTTISDNKRRTLLKDKEKFNEYANKKIYALNEEFNNMDKTDLNRYIELISKDMTEEDFCKKFNERSAKSLINAKQLEPYKPVYLRIFRLAKIQTLEKEIANAC